MRPRPRSVARGLTVAAAVTLLTGAGIAVAATQASAAAGCRVTYSVNQWSTGFTGNLAVTNLGDPITGRSPRGPSSSRIAFRLDVVLRR